MTGNELKQRRKSLGLTQEQLARSLDVTLSSVARWEQLNDGEVPNSRILELAFDSLEGERKKKGGK
jgi:transcriptional regulator with XRE-family HTH domain